MPLLIGENRPWVDSLVSLDRAVAMIPESRE